MLSISLDQQKLNNIHEAYTFQFLYAEGQTPSLLIRDRKQGKSTTPLPLDAAKRNMQLLFRQLIAMTQSLNPLPDDTDKFLSIRLFFTDATPEDYQPPGFRAASEAESARFVTQFLHDRPHEQDIGSMNTGYHACTLKVSSICDLLDDEQEQRERSDRFWDAEHSAKLNRRDLVPHLVSRSFSQHEGLETSQSDYNKPVPGLHNSTQFDHDMPTTHESTSEEPTQLLTCTQQSQQRADLQPDDTQNRSGAIYTAHSTASTCSGPTTRARTTVRDQTEYSLTKLGDTYEQMSLKQNPDPIDKTDLTVQGNSRAHAMVQGLTSHKSSPKQENLDPSQPDVVSCECGDLSDDGIMVQCEHCQGWSHLPCYVSLFSRSSRGLM